MRTLKWNRSTLHSRKSHRCTHVHISTGLIDRRSGPDAREMIDVWIEMDGVRLEMDSVRLEMDRVRAEMGGVCIEMDVRRRATMCRRAKEERTRCSDAPRSRNPRLDNGFG